MKNAADVSAVKEAERTERYTEKQNLLDFRAIMEQPGGRRFVAYLLDTCGFQKTSFTGNSTTFFNEGRRSIALELWAKINEACPDLYLRMIAEAKEKSDVQ